MAKQAVCNVGCGSFGGDASAGVNRPLIRRAQAATCAANGSRGVLLICVERSDQKAETLFYLAGNKDQGSEENKVRESVDANVSECAFTMEGGMGCMLAGASGKIVGAG